ncbi:MAG: hypothetical protein J5506_10860 [Prevotella sp.]|nr:hypothetical protein [Prevotella sp.]
MKLKEYQKPYIKLLAVGGCQLLEGTGPEIPFDPGSGTPDAFAPEADYDDEEETTVRRSVWEE